MPDKPITVLTYAASASLAAVALVYFFNPNYLIDGETAGSASSRKKGVVGLSNPANDCFINCVLQSLAGLGDLRLYLIREVHRRELGPKTIYESVPLKDARGKEVNPDKMRSLQGGEVTQGLKDMIDRLNERPIYKKTISAVGFIRVLESAFRTRIAKSQQDAQELLQIVAERLLEEYQAGKQARKTARKGLNGSSSANEGSKEGDQLRHSKIEEEPEAAQSTGEAGTEDPQQEEEDGFPLEGQMEAKTECQFCKFIPKVKPSSFVMLTLSVPQQSSSTLNECFDAQFKTEYIDDYKCDKCRLEHAKQVRENDLAKAKSEKERLSIETELEKLRFAIKEDPEKVPEGVSLPDSKLAPKRKIGRYAEITKFPKILIMHLSRSIYDPRNSSTKNLSKLSFPERFPVGGLLNRRSYKLLGMVSHKGTHNNGHYETFRRQHIYAPSSNPHVDRALGPYSISPATTPSPSRVSTPQTAKLSPTPSAHTTPTISHSAGPEDSSNSIQSYSTSPRSTKTNPSTRPTSGTDDDMSEDAYTLKPAPTSPTLSKASAKPKPANGAPFTTRPTSFSTFATISSNKDERPASTSAATITDAARFKRKKRPPTDRWWRISDDKIKECKTADVLSMQREVYLLFYEMEKD